MAEARLTLVGRFGAAPNRVAHLESKLRDYSGTQNNGRRPVALGLFGTP
jgi:hypothetical protein